MPKSSLPKYVVAIPDRKGALRYYFRIAGKYQRLPDDPASPAFYEAYAQRLANTKAAPGIGKAAAKPGSLAALIADFKDSPEFKVRLTSERTRVSYAQQLDRLSCLGTFPAKDVGRAQILKLRDKISAKRGTRTADLFIAVARRLFSFALDREIVTVNPLSHVARVNIEESYAPWTPLEFEAFRTSKPPQWALTAAMLARWTAAARSDVLGMCREHYDGAAIRYTRAKTRRHQVGEMTITCHTELRRYLDALPIEVGLLVPDPRGGRWNESAFSKAFRTALDDAGLKHLHFHGLRHTQATDIAEAGGSEAEIAAVTGHQSPAMVKRYTKRARQERLAAQAIARLETGRKRRFKNRRGTQKC